MTELNFQEIKDKIKEVQGILSKLDHVVALYLRPKIYSNGDCFIELSESEKLKLVNEYRQIKEELESKVGELPE